MSIRDWLKRKEHGNGGNKYYYRELEDGTAITIYSFVHQERLGYQDGTHTNLAIARGVKQRPQDTIHLSYSDFIAFELPEAVTISDDIMQAVMDQYGKDYKEDDKRPATYYFGQLIDKTFSKKNSAVQKLVNQRVQEIIEKEKRNQQPRENYSFSQGLRINEEVSKKQRIITETAIQRIKNPYLIRKNLRTNQIDYDGVNLVNGNVLRIRAVQKLGKTPDGTSYLYTAYLSNTQSETDVEIISEKPIGYPVCFELPGRLDDIIQGGNNININIRNVLELLSDGWGENREMLSYIGKLDNLGNITRDLQLTSDVMRENVQRMMENFQPGR